MTVSLNQISEQDKLLQLALNAYRSGEESKALSYLKEAASRKDATAATHYLLAGEYAQLGAYDRGIVHMEAALTIDPALDIARLILGLLLLTFGHGENWSEPLGLDHLGLKNYHFILPSPSDSLQRRVSIRCNLTVRLGEAGRESQWHEICHLLSLLIN